MSTYSNMKVRTDASNLAIIWHLPFLSALPIDTYSFSFTRSRILTDCVLFGRRTLLEIDDDRETKETERTRESATRAIHYVTLVELAHQQRVSSIFFAWSKEDEHSELLNYRRDHNASFLPLLSLHTYSLCVALLSYNAIYTVVVKVRIMSLRFYCFYPPPPLARDCDQVTSCSP